MPEVAALFAERNRVSMIAREIRTSVKTVWEWKRKGVIPPWRRAAVLGAVQRLDLAVPAEVIAYLARAE